MTYKHNFRDPNLNNLHCSMTYTGDEEPTIRVEVTKIPEVEVKNDSGVPLKVDVVTIPEVEVKNEVGNPLKVDVVTMPEVEVKNDTGNPLRVNVTNIPEVEIKNDSGSPIPVSGTVNIGTIPEVEIKNNVGNPITVSGQVDITGLPPVYLADNYTNDASGRLRVSEARLLGEFRNMYGTTGPVEMVSHFEGAGSQTVLLAETSTLLTVTTTAGDRAVRQSRQYHAYIPGASQSAAVTFTMASAQVGLTQMVGLFDDGNGILFCLRDNTAEFIIRRGGVDTEIVPQTLWNIDRLDGTGASGITLDLTKSQILLIDYRWLGVGRVRVGFEINGQAVYAHQFNHANIITGAYMYQPSLPVRWEIKNTADTTSDSVLRCICYSVYSEGSEYESGFTSSISTGSTALTISDSTPLGIIALRLKNSVNGIPMRALARLSSWYLMSNVDVHYRVIVLPGSAGLQGTPVWLPTGGTTWTEYTTNFHLSSDQTYTQTIYDGFSPGNVGNNSASPVLSAATNRSTAIYQNYACTDSMIIAVVGYKMNNNATVHASLCWVEVK